MSSSSKSIDLVEVASEIIKSSREKGERVSVEIKKRDGKVVELYVERGDKSIERIWVDELGRLSSRVVE